MPFKDLPTSVGQPESVRGATLQAIPRDPVPRTRVRNHLDEYTRKRTSLLKSTVLNLRPVLQHQGKGCNMQREAVSLILNKVLELSFLAKWYGDLEASDYHRKDHAQL
jgi:hypothetical protein